MEKIVTFLKNNVTLDRTDDWIFADSPTITPTPPVIIVVFRGLAEKRGFLCDTGYLIDYVFDIELAVHRDNSYTINEEKKTGQELRAYLTNKIIECFIEKDEELESQLSNAVDVSLKDIRYHPYDVSTGIYRATITISVLQHWKLS